MRRSTIIFLLLFAVAMGVYYYLKNRPEPADATATLEPQAEVSYLFNASDGQPTGIRVESKAGEVVELARNASKAWALILPFAASADQGSVEAAVSQITTIRITDKLSADVKASDVGLDSPEYKLSVKFDSGVERIAEIGVSTPTESGYYVQTNGEIVIVSKAAIDSLTGLLTNPPYAETPTPSLIPPTATDTSLPPTPETATLTGPSATPKP